MLALSVTSKRVLRESIVGAVDILFKSSIVKVIDYDPVPGSDGPLIETKP